VIPYRFGCCVSCKLAPGIVQTLIFYESVVVSHVYYTDFLFIGKWSCLKIIRHMIIYSFTPWLWCKQIFKFSDVPMYSRVTLRTRSFGPNIFITNHTEQPWFFMKIYLN
jgi:hypothetical protein